METHLRDRLEELSGRGYSVEKAFNQAVEKFGEDDQVGDEVYKTKNTPARWGGVEI